MDDPFSTGGQTGDFNPPPPPPPPPPPSPSGGYNPMTSGTGGPTPPPAAFPPGAGAQPPGAAGSPPPPPKPPSPPANFQLGKKLAAHLNVKIPAHSLKFDEQYFLHLLAGSISLTKDEKARIIESIPKLKQSQVDELMRIFEEERRKFAELGSEHTVQLEKLVQQHYDDWMDIEMKQEQSGKAQEDAAKAEEIRKQLGL